MFLETKVKTSYVRNGSSVLESEDVAHNNSITDVCSHQATDF